MTDLEGDAWGDALNDFLDHRLRSELVLEVDDGTTRPALQPAWFFRTYDEWDWWEQHLLDAVRGGPVLDLGAGAGRAALHFQERGLDATAVEASGGAAEVCRRRGVRDVRVADLNDPPGDRSWRAVLLLCGNIGLGGTWEGNRELLARLAMVVAPEATLIGDSVAWDGRPEISLRLRYGDVVTPWWRQRNIAPEELSDLVEGTGWTVENHLVADHSHAFMLRRL